MQKCAEKAHIGAIVIQILVIAVLQSIVTPLQPKLSSRTTKDLQFHCDMKGFNAPLSSMLSLQIAKRADDTNGQDVVLATVDSGEAWLSQYVAERDEHRHYVSGRLDLSQKRNAWLELRITDITPQEYGLYSCHIHYTDHPADTKHSTWTKEFLVDETVSEASESGFRIRLSKGVHIECDSGVLDETDGHVTQMKISAVKSERHWFASWCEDTNTSTCSPELLGPYHRGQRRSANEGILEVHIPDATCHHQSKHVCAVTTSSGKTMQFLSERLPLEECQQEPKTEPLSSTASPTVARPTTVEQDDSKVMFYVAPAIVVFIVFAFVALICFCRKKFKNSNDRSVNKTRPWMMNWGCAKKSIQVEEIEHLQYTSLVKMRSQKCPPGATDQPLLSSSETESKSNTDDLAHDLLAKLEENDLGPKAHIVQMKPDTVYGSRQLPATESNRNNIFAEERVIDVHANSAYERSQSSGSDSSHSSESSADCEGVSVREIKTPVQASQSPEEVVIVE